jgi:hypothetical protein
MCCSAQPEQGDEGGADSGRTVCAHAFLPCGRSGLFSICILIEIIGVPPCQISRAALSLPIIDLGASG